MKVPQIGITDDFFRMGGDSILCIYVTTKLREKGIHCTVISIFEYRCIEKLIPHISIHTEEVEPTEESVIEVSPELLQRLNAHYQTETTLQDVES